MRNSSVYHIDIDMMTKLLL